MHQDFLNLKIINWEKDLNWHRLILRKSITVVMKWMEIAHEMKKKNSLKLWKMKCLMSLITLLETLSKLIRFKAFLLKLNNLNLLIYCKLLKAKLMMPLKKSNNVKVLLTNLRMRLLNGTHRKSFVEEMKSLKKLIIFLKISKMI